MKKILFMVMCLAAAACTNLDEQIYSKIEKDSFFTSEEQFAKYSARAYSSLQHWGTEKSYWSFDMEITDEICTPFNPNGGWGNANNGRYIEVQTHDISNSNSLLEPAWDFCFNGISACNDVLDTFNSVDRDFDAKNRVIAEVKVLRAFYYFMAICYWKNVPYAITKKIEGYPEKKDRQFIFSFIEKEIKDNIDYLAVEPTTTYYGRVTRGVADFVLAKLYLNAEFLVGTPKWAEAEAACKDIMTANKGASYYKIVDDYKSIFAIKNEFNEEGIFAIPYSTVYTTSDHYAFLLYISTLPPNLCEPLGIAAKAWDGYVGQPDFLDSYDASDKRKAWTWMYGQMYDINGNALTIEVPDPANPENGIVVPYIIETDFPESTFDNTQRTHLQGARIGKWAFQSDMTLTGGQVGMENDVYLMRYADVVLMYAEAMVRQNKGGEVIGNADLDKIRTRAGLPLFTAETLTLDNLYQERSHELAVEGWHRQDMIRFDKYLAAWWGKPAMDENDYDLPIPKAAKAANPNLK
jgi:hypothetical protein